MVNTKMSELGQEIDHTRKMGKSPILGDGAAKAGMMVGRLSTGKAAAIDADSATVGISFVGVMDKSYKTDIDVAIPDAQLENVLHPKSGDILSAFIEDLGADLQEGVPLTWGQTTAGSLKKIATKAATGNLTHSIDLTGNAQVIVIEPIVAYTATKVLNTATACLIRWK
jgi:hypothetical protein